MAYKLGKKLARHDTRTLHLSKLLTANLPDAPDVVDLSGGETNWEMLANDALGDCTVAAALHLDMCWLTNVGSAFMPTDAQAIAAYSAITGYNPDDPSTDQGAVELDVLNYWRKTGIAGHKILGFAALEPKNINHIKQSVYLFGGTYIGVQLPLSAQGQASWSVVGNGISGDSAPGSWGGHAVCVVGYDAGGLWVVTWGQLLYMTWAFWNAYCDEAYAVFSTDMLAAGRSPQGFDLAALQAYLAQVGTMEAVPSPAKPRAAINGGYTMDVPVLVNGRVPLTADPYWQIANDLMDAGFDVDLFAWNDSRKINPMIYAFYVAYSFGGARLFKDLAGKIAAVVLLITSVPNWEEYGQWDICQAGAWPINAGDVTGAVCVQMDAWPASCPLAGAPWTTLTSATEDANTIDLSQPFLNINADTLISPLNPVGRHTDIKDTQFVRTLAGRMGRKALEVVNV